MKKTAIAVILALLLALMLVTLSQTELARAESIIYIKADGSVDGTDKIQRDENVYTFTEDLFVKIVVEKSNITVDGKGFKLNGSGSDIGLDLNNVHGVTVKNINIQNFGTGIVAGAKNTLSGNIITGNAAGIDLTGDDSFISGNKMTDNGHALVSMGSSRNVISGNTITNNEYGFQGTPNYSLISGNNLTNNKFHGLYFLYSVNNTISGNIIANNGWAAIYFVHCWDNTISENNIVDNDRGIDFKFDSTPSFNNTIYSNNFVNNAMQVLIGNVSINIWDNGTFGNYWSDYQTKYPNAEETDSTGKGNTAYIIDANNKDNYPLMKPITNHNPPLPTASPSPSPSIEPTQSPEPQQPESFPPTLVIGIAVAVAVIGIGLFVYFKKLRK